MVGSPCIKNLSLRGVGMRRRAVGSMGGNAGSEKPPFTNSKGRLGVSQTALAVKHNVVSPPS